MNNLRRVIDTDYTGGIYTSPVKHRRDGHALSPDIVGRICELYPYTSNKAIAEELGIHRASVVRYAHRLGITKDADYLRIMRTEKSRRARAVQVEIQKEHPRRNWKSKFQKGMSHMQPEQKVEWRQHISEGRQRTIRQERRRIDFGLPQKTDMRLGRQPKKKLNLKSRLKKKGYRIDNEQGIAYYNEHTTRATICERRGNPWFVFKREENEQDTDSLQNKAAGA